MSDPESTARSSSSDESRSPGGTSSSESSTQESKNEVKTLKQLSDCKITRTELARFVYCPFFEKLVVGCYARIGLGNNNGVPQYRIVEILGVVETEKVYTFEGKRTNKGLKMRNGADQRVFRMEFISNQPFEQKEWDQWSAVMDKKKVPKPTLDQLAEKKKELVKCRKHALSDAEIDYIVKEKKRFSDGPTNFAMEKNRLMTEKAKAEEKNDPELASKIQHELDQLIEKDMEHARTQAPSAAELINQKRRQESKQTVTESYKMNYEPSCENEGDPFTRKTNRSKLAPEPKRRRMEEGDQQG